MIMPIKRANELTGRCRVRSGWFGQLILQVEVRTMTYSACPPPPNHNRHEWLMKMRANGSQVLSWRDAYMAGPVHRCRAGPHAADFVTKPFAVRRTTVDRNEWEQRYATRLIERGGMDEKNAANNAKAAAEQNLEDSGDQWLDPEGSADEEMNYWDDDGA